MKNTLIFLFLIISAASCSQGKSKIYFDNEWNETMKESASYYRTQSKKANGIWFIEDFYISGEKQFVGHAKDSLATILEGDATWYFTSGKVQSKLHYEQGEVTGFYTTVEGAKGSTTEGWNEHDLYFVDETNVLSAADAKSTSTNTYEYYYTNTYNIAIEHTSHMRPEGNSSVTHYFNIIGDTIGRLDFNESAEKWYGKEVLFYEEELRGKNGMNSVKEIKTYNDGQHTHSLFYNIQEQLIAEATFKDHKVFNGTLFIEACLYQKLQKYKNGKLLKETTYKNNETIGELIYKDNRPYAGVNYDCTTEETYKNGKLHGPVIQYFNTDGASVEFEFSYKSGRKEGDYVIYETDSNLLEKGSYKNGIPTGKVFYYHNEVLFEGEGEDEIEIKNNYYLTTHIESRNNKPYISELFRYNSDTQELIATYKFEKNTTDRFTYLDNGYHSVDMEDFNNDGYEDLKIIFYHHLNDSSSITYYLYNSKTNTYKHLAELDDADDVVINAAENSISVTLSSDMEEQILIKSFTISEGKLIPSLEIEKVYHREKDTTIITQIFPIPLDKFPLLATNLPFPTIVQQGKEQQMESSHQEIVLQKESFSIRFPGIIDSGSFNDFRVMVTASYSNEVFKRASIGQKEEDSTIFGIASSFAGGANKPLFIIADDGNNLFYYDNTLEDTLTYLKNINEKVLLLEFDVDKLHDGDKETTVSELNNPLYLVMYVDKNQNQKIDIGEIHYVTLLFL